MRRLVCAIRGHRRAHKSVRSGDGFALVSYCDRCDRIFWGLE